jgi:hypothetical protein
MALATMVLNAIAITASTRLGQVLTLVIVVGMFVLGLLSDWLFARPLAELSKEMAALAAAGGETTTLMYVKYATLAGLRAVVPNFQIFWLSDALTQEQPIPGEYIGYAVPYTLTLVTALLSLATMLFQRREVG